MSKETTGKKIGAGLAACVLAVLLIISCVVSLIAIKPGSAEAGSAVDKASELTVKKVTAFDEDSVRTNAVFTDMILKRVCGAALAFKGNEAELETIASTLSFDSVIVTDEKGKITASYPDDLKGKALKDDPKTLSLTPVAKGITNKAMGNITENEDGTYQITAAARRTDREEGGAVAVVLTNDTYGAVQGKELAASCGENVIIEKDGKRLSSSFADAGETSIADLGVKEDDKAVSIKANGKDYDAKAATVGEYHTLTAVAPQASGGNGWGTFWIIAITDIVLAAAGIIIFMVAGKSKAK